MKQPEDTATPELPMLDPGAQSVAEFEGITANIWGKLFDAKVRTRDDLAELCVDELMAITGQSEDEAHDLIKHARAHWFKEDTALPAPRWSTNDKKRIDPNWPFQLSIGKAPVVPSLASLSVRRDALKVALAVNTQRNPGTGFRERERLKRKAARWTAKLAGMPAEERAFIRAALDTLDKNGEAA